MNLVLELVPSVSELSELVLNFSDLFVHCSLSDLFDWIISNKMMPWKQSCRHESSLVARRICHRITIYLYIWLICFTMTASAIRLLLDLLFEYQCVYMILVPIFGVLWYPTRVLSVDTLFFTQRNPHPTLLYKFTHIHQLGKFPNLPTPQLWRPPQWFQVYASLVSITVHGRWVEVKSRCYITCQWLPHVIPDIKLSLVIFTYIYTLHQLSLIVIPLPKNLIATEA